MKFTTIAALVAWTNANDFLIGHESENGPEGLAVNQDEAVTKKANELSAFLNDKNVEIADGFSSSEYLASAAATKKDQLWAKVVADRSSGSFPSAVELPGIFLEAMDPTFTTPGDQMPSELFGLRTRTKYIHSVGVVGKVKFVSSGNHPFTGVWEGAQHGLVRLSSAAEPSSSQPLAPGLGLKFLRDGVDSADLVAMYSVSGTPGNWNFFEKDFSNHIGAASGTALKAVALKFSTETSWIQSVGLSDMAKYNEAGAEATAPIFPFKLRFHPNTAASGLISNTQPSDYMAYTSQLESVPADTALYDIYGQDGPWELGGVEHFMGTLQLDGQLTKSKWGDEQLFFRHQLSSDDMALKPEWEAHYAKFKALGAEATSKLTKCPYKELLKSLYGQ